MKICQTSKTILSLKKVSVNENKNKFLIKSQPVVSSLLAYQCCSLLISCHRVRQNPLRRTGDSCFSMLVHSTESLFDLEKTLLFNERPIYAVKIVLHAPLQ